MRLVCLRTPHAFNLFILLRDRSGSTTNKREKGKGIIPPPRKNKNKNKI